MTKAKRKRLNSKATDTSPRGAVVPRAKVEPRQTLQEHNANEVNKLWGSEVQELMSAGVSNLNEAIDKLVDLVLKRNDTPREQYNEHREFLRDLFAVDEELKQELAFLLKVKPG